MKLAKIILPMMMAFSLSGCSLLSNLLSGGKSSNNTSSSSNTSSKTTSPEHIEISFDDIVADYAEEGVVVSIPYYIGNESVTYEANQGVYYIYNSTNDEMQEFAANLIASRWVLEEDSYGDYSGSYLDTRASVYVGDYLEIDGYECIVVSFGYLPSETFPSETIASDLASVGVTDIVPVFTGSAKGFDYYSEAGERQLTIYVSDDSTESATINRYKNDLTIAGYTEAGKDEYGDMHYTSPHNQLDICAWAGSDIGYDGYVFVDIVVK